MKIIVPMAGRGSRLRPHTLTVPKPLIPIAGKTIVQRLIEDIANVINQKIEEIAFIIHKDFGSQVPKDLVSIAEKLGAKGIIYYQEEPLGTAHAIMNAKEIMTGPVIIVYADTLFRMNFSLDSVEENVIWVKQVEDPRDFGVVQLNSNNEIIDFVEKPKEFVSDLAIIGIYYFKTGEILREELQYLLDNNITKGGEYQLTDALDNMRKKGIKFIPGTVSEWMDCGNKKVAIETNSKMLDLLQQEGKNLVSDNITLENSFIIPPCYIGENVILKNSKIGPYVSLGENSVVTESSIENSLIQSHVTIQNAHLKEAMIGNHVFLDGRFTKISIGDYCVLE